MLNQLGDIATALGMTFGYGTLSHLEEIAQTLESGYLLFHENFLLADLSEDGQGALEYRHRLVLDICTPSLITDKAPNRRTRLDALDLQMRKVYVALKKYGQRSNARVEVGLSLTSRSLDAIKLTITVLPDAVSLCNL